MIAVGGGATAALAIYGFLTTTLSGPAIGGVVPQGTAAINRSKLPTKPGTLCLRVTGVNLPDGTVLNVVLTDCWVRRRRDVQAQRRRWEDEHGAPRRLPDRAHLGDLREERWHDHPVGWSTLVGVFENNCKCNNCK